MRSPSRYWRIEIVRLAVMAAVLALCTATSGSPIDAATATPAQPHDPRAFCARTGNDDTLRPPPPSLMPAIRRLFHIRGHLPPAAAYYRCAGGEVMACWVGANLPCGKANTSKDLPAASRWCETHANSDFIPLYVTGHDSIYSWRCAEGKAEAGAPVSNIDARGFFRRYWKIVK